MSVFADRLSIGAVPGLMSSMGDSGSVTYTPAGDDAEAVGLTAVIGPIEEEEDEDEHGRYLRITRTVLISTDPASDYGGVAAPAKNATVTVDGVEWAIHSIPSITANLARLLLFRRGRIEVSRRGYRS